MTGLQILAESAATADARTLIAALDAYLGAIYPTEHNHLLDIAALTQPNIRFFIARLDGNAVGCAALRIADSYGEIKRMFVTEAARGQHVGRALLERLEQEARLLSLPVVRLETGVRQAAALTLYRAAGYRDIGAFGEYAPDPLSLFLEKSLA